MRVVERFRVGVLNYGRFVLALVLLGVASLSVWILVEPAKAISALDGTRAALWSGMQPTAERIWSESGQSITAVLAPGIYAFRKLNIVVDGWVDWIVIAFVSCWVWWKVATATWWLIGPDWREFFSLALVRKWLNRVEAAVAQQITREGNAELYMGAGLAFAVFLLAGVGVQVWNEAERPWLGVLGGLALGLGALGTAYYFVVRVALDAVPTAAAFTNRRFRETQHPYRLGSLSILALTIVCAYGLWVLALPVPPPQALLGQVLLFVPFMAIAIPLTIAAFVSAFALVGPALYGVLVLVVWGIFEARNSPGPKSPEQT